MDNTHDGTCGQLADGDHEAAERKDGTAEKAAANFRVWLFGEPGKFDEEKTDVGLPRFRWREHVQEVDDAAQVSVAVLSEAVRICVRLEKLRVPSGNRAEVNELLMRFNSLFEAEKSDSVLMLLMDQDTGEVSGVEYVPLSMLMARPQFVRKVSVERLGMIAGTIVDVVFKMKATPTSAVETFDEFECLKLN